jgi:hypothetical protein
MVKMILQFSVEKWDTDFTDSTDFLLKKDCNVFLPVQCIFYALMHTCALYLF